MKLYVLRHGLAAQRDGHKYPDDRARPLTAKGKKKAREIGAALAGMGGGCEVVLSSPLTRALQTAELVAGCLDGKRSVRVAEELAPEGDPEGLIERLKRELPGDGAVMLVGHEPYLSRLIAVLLTGRATGVRLDLKKGGLCRLEIEELRYGQCAVLEWLLTPKVMLGIGH
jgi:phosphohistidine phosphatase